MPIFEYICKDCDNKFEKLVLNSDDKISCDCCESRNLEKIFSTFGVKAESSFSTRSESVGSGCMCTPASCGCSVK